MSEVIERRPRDQREWTRLFWRPRQCEHESAWRCGPIVVISELAIAELPGLPGENGPQWHVSISAGGKRPKPHHVRKALRAFGMLGAEEDNHYPGVSRAFWMTVDPALRGQCECKESEETIAEEDGFKWQNPSEGEGQCRGCEYEHMFGGTCPIHKGKAK